MQQEELSKTTPSMSNVAPSGATSATTSVATSGATSGDSSGFSSAKSSGKSSDVGAYAGASAHDSINNFAVNSGGAASVSSGTHMNSNWVVHPDKDLEDLIPTFLQNRRNELEEIDSAVAKADFEFIRRTAHTWKGICRPYGFIHLETLSKSLEVAGEEENQSKTQEIAGEIRDYLKNVQVVYDA